MEAEDVDRSDQVGQGAGGEDLALALDEGVEDGLQIGLQGLGVSIGLGDQGGGPGRGLAGQQRIGGRQPGVDPAQGPAIGLVKPVGRGVARGLGQRLEGRRHLGQFAGDGEFGAQGVDALQIGLKSGLGLPGEGLPLDCVGDEGVAVAVAADPRADPQETRQLGLQLPTPMGVEPGQFGQEAALEIGDGGLDLIDDAQANAAQQPRAPEDRHFAQQFGFQRLARLVARGLLPGGKSRGYGACPVQYALAPDFGGMGGDHRCNQAAGQQFGDPIGRHALGGQGA